MTKEKMTAEELQTALRHFTGTEQWYRVSLTGIVTDGVKFLCDEAECYWLMDVIASYIPKISLNFAVVKMTVNQETGKAKILIDNGYDKDEKEYKVFATQIIPFTDFPLSEIKLYVENNVIYLPSEH